MTKVQVFCLRSLDGPGTGDTIRARTIVNALAGAGHDVCAISILGPRERLIRATASLRVLRRLAVLLTRFGRHRPLQWILVQAVAEARDVPLTGIADARVYVTSRVVPDSWSRDSAIDYVDALSRNAESRALQSIFLRSLWLREAHLLKDWEASLAHAAVTTAVSALDAAHISARVQLLPIGVERSADSGATRRTAPPIVAFTGNLHYAPNAEAARWIVDKLVPELVARGWSADRVIIAGRRPSRSLRRRAERAGARLLVDVADMGAVLATSSVALAPMRLGSGVQTKVFDALAARVPVVLTHKANEGLRLGDSAMVRVVERTPRAFADSVTELSSAAHCPPIPDDVQRLLSETSIEDVSQRWLSVLAPVLEHS